MLQADEKVEEVEVDQVARGSRLFYVLGDDESDDSDGEDEDDDEER